jgi:hypothetical protein
VGNIPQAPVAAGTPEPVTEYEISGLEGGLEPGAFTFVVQPTATTVIAVGFGLYVADFDPTTGLFVTQDPLDSTHVCRDNWTHLEWFNVDYNATGVVIPFLPGLITSGQATMGRRFRFTSGPRTLKEGKALMASINFQTTAGTILGVTPYFRYHLRVIT